MSFDEREEDLGKVECVFIEVADDSNIGKEANK